MARFKSVPTIATKRDTAAPVSRKPKDEVTDDDLKMSSPLTDEENEERLNQMVKPLPSDDEEEEIVVEEKKASVLLKEKEGIVDEPIEKKPQEKKEEKKEEPKASSKPKKIVTAKKPEPKKEEAKPEVKEEPKKEETKPEVKPEPAKEEVKPEPAKEEAKQEEPARPLTPEEKKARLMENLRKGREKAMAQRQAQAAQEAQRAQNTENGTVAKKPVPKPKKAVDMSKMMMMTKKPQASASNKTCYHVSKRGETKEDRVWKVFIQESDKVIKLFDTQQEALDYAKTLAKNKGDGSYVILHGLDGKIRKF